MKLSLNMVLGVFGIFIVTSIGWFILGLLLLVFIDGPEATTCLIAWGKAIKWLIIGFFVTVFLYGISPIARKEGEELKLRNQAIKNIKNKPTEADKEIEAEMNRITELNQ